MGLFVGDRPEDEECARLAGFPFQWAKDWRAGGGAWRAGMSISFEIKDAPGSARSRGRYKEIIETLLQLPVGKSIVVPKGTFGVSGLAEPALGMFRRTGRQLHQRTLPDGIYLWLDPPEQAKDLEP